jgi:hypothetical protein
MERALSLANSILRQRARVARLALHAYAIESAMEERAQTPPAQLSLSDNWQPTGTTQEENPPTAPETQARSSMRGRLDEDFPTCYVEEVPYTENTLTALEPQARDNTRGRLCEDFPTCYVEEVPYMDVVSQGTCAVMVHHTDIAAMDKDEASAERRHSKDLNKPQGLGISKLIVIFCKTVSIGENVNLHCTPRQMSKVGLQLFSYMLMILYYG